MSFSLHRQDDHAHQTRRSPITTHSDTPQLTYPELNKLVKEGAIALRCRRKLLPAGGDGDKVFPPTYEGGKYAFEDRIIEGKTVRCVLLDSVQSQANRMEQALKRAFFHPETNPPTADIPIVAVDFGSAGFPDIGWITTLDAPHRIADAIFRDSLLNGTLFRNTSTGRAFTNASLDNATALYQVCPTALIFGMWDSTGPGGGLGVKIQRAIVSEIVGVNAVLGVKTSSRIDPLSIESQAGPLYETPDGNWTLDPEKATKVEKNPKKLGKHGKPSEANLGNITPSISDGGVTVDYILQTTVISLSALRRIRFPVGGCSADLEGRSALAALALCAASLAQNDLDLRSRCCVAPASGDDVWEVVRQIGAYSLSAKQATSLLSEAVQKAKEKSLVWDPNVVVLQPTPELVELVRRSRELKQAAISTEE